MHVNKNNKKHYRIYAKSQSHVMQIIRKKKEMKIFKSKGGRFSLVFV